MRGRRGRVLRNAAAEADQFRRRALLAFAGVVLALGALALGYLRLQVWQHADYATRSEANRIKLRPVVPGRGLIYDRQGRILADNVPAFRLDVTPSEAGDPKDWLPQLQRIVALSAEDIAGFEDSRRASRGFKPVTLKLRVSEDEAARFAVDRWRYPGIELVSYLNRRYLHGELFSHVIGYVGRIDVADLAQMGETQSSFSHTGKTGLERSYEETLRGRIGYEKVETDVNGRPMGLLGRVPAVPGADLRLSLDLDLQRAMVAAFGDKEGSAVAVDPRSGQVLAMISLPGYDTNLFVNGISHADYKALTENPSRPLFNRNVLGGGPPGSTVKPLMALAGLDSGLRRASDKTLSTGEFFIPGQRRGYRDSRPGGHGWVDLRESIAQSANTYYYKLARDMGIDKLAGYMDRYGFGQPSGIDLVGEKDGIVPSRAWKAGNREEPWYPGETVIAGIGQGYWIATALQLGRSTAAIANGGDLHPLRLVEARRDGYDAQWKDLPHAAAPRITDRPEHLVAVQEGMVATVHGNRGTATAIGRGSPYLIAGKTGTAQNSSRKGSISVDPRNLPYHLRHTGLFIGYAPADDPRIAIAVVVEHGGYGGSAAAPIAKAVFDAWLLGKMPEPLPEGERHGPPVVATEMAPMSPSPAGRGVGVRVRRSDEAPESAASAQSLGDELQPARSAEPSHPKGASSGASALRAPSPAGRSNHGMAP